ncbi:metallophosphoesterase domain-containing protein [Cavenderia fasciculata]|uniref:Purple acid phosphatase n=1 Tax=Cavenderia fasciculata TaxID=261658 RepID=F4PIX4_CACFS|nr:metallophosphoesterase domain-containing protein [Cavenderia fasciculata]EGG24260.1 metallophosphoesterase domain-containing protein [Cavenderia fasciculata]|eukprot:XP_004362111.1 metallophosphoesterase domain-containing protein [Cavenderia fasciculata]
MKVLFIFTTLLAIVFAASNNVTPQSVKLALTTTSPSSMRVSWFTYNSGSSPSALLSVDGQFNPYDYNAANVALFTGSSEGYDTFQWSGYINTAVMSDLQEHTTYYYSCGDKESNKWSQVYNFTTAAAPAEQSFVTPFQIVAYGDMGISGNNTQTLQAIEQRIDTTAFILHVGDIAYADLGKSALDSIGGNQTIWNEFLNVITPLSSTLPYMVCPGNHDIFYDLAAYRRTFLMPVESNDDNYYAFDYNGIHFISFSTELFIPFSPQHLWLESHLREFRKSNPNGWLVVYAHRPIYCSTTWSWCNTDTYRVIIQDSIEPLFKKYNVDLYITGHAHSYERSLPVYSGEVAGTYEKPEATVHIVKQQQQQQILTMVMSKMVGGRFLLTGYGLLSFENDTSLHWEFYGPEDTVLDEFYLTKANMHIFPNLQSIDIVAENLDNNATRAILEVIKVFPVNLEITIDDEYRSLVTRVARPNQIFEIPQFHVIIFDVDMTSLGAILKELWLKGLHDHEPFIDEDEDDDEEEENNHNEEEEVNEVEEGNDNEEEEFNGIVQKIEREASLFAQIWQENQTIAILGLSKLPKIISPQFFSSLSLNHSITTLILTDGTLKQEHIPSFCQLLVDNQTIKSLDIHWNNLEPSEELDEAIKHNNSIKVKTGDN